MLNPLFYDRERSASILDPAGDLSHILDAKTVGRTDMGSDLAKDCRDFAALGGLFDWTPGFMAIFTGPDHVIAAANKAYCRLVGHSDLVGKRAREAMPELADQGFFDPFEAVSQSGRPFLCREMELRIQDGSSDACLCRWIDLVYQPISDASGVYSAVLVQGHEVTEQTLARDALKEIAERYRYTMELSGQIPWTADPDGNIETADRRWTELTGQFAEEALGEGWNRVVHPEDAPLALARWRAAVKRGVSIESEFRVRGTNNRYYWHRVCAAPHKTPEGRIMRWYGTIEDVEERMGTAEQLRQTQAELIHVSRLSAMGAMGSTLAHELNQPLAAVTNYLRGGQRILAQVPGEAVNTALKAMRAADRSAMRAGEIVRRLREIATRGDVQRHPECVSDLIQKACQIGLVDASLKGVSYQCVFDEEITMVLVDRVQIQQVLINLLRNAVEALQDASRREIVIGTSIIDAETCEVFVHDSGPGVPREIESKLFSPFNSSKPEGMGIGLSISRTIIESHGGRISYESGEDGGATFRFTLARTRPNSSIG